MQVYILETKKTGLRGEKVSFYFKDKRDADAFVYVFKDHWCHVDFEGRYQIVSDYDKHIEFMNQDPIKRAESNLSWGFNFARSHGDDELTIDERSFIRQIHKRLNLNV